MPHATHAHAQPSPLPPDVLRALSALDDRLIAKLASGAIRLASVEWLEVQPEGFLMPFRQQLEEEEKSGASPSPLLTPDEAVELIKRGDRSVGVLSQYAY